ncbi:hypothetical protein PV371_27350 [Streptomyces sp. TX20-6-3]|uniref:hypothetical protein n=1 Tax=Streptomyces sp. TX20-6-3 TaxID=3028705 RepID=UPI0029AF5F5D|nr:hypothetical protein [Streptomyces sp. TX20-6-3]MDX2563342.1 hypothetical protein [Streptomyces sp. TX20-6-3]
MAAPVEAAVERTGAAIAARVEAAVERTGAAIAARVEAAGTAMTGRADAVVRHARGAWARG